MNVNIKYIKDEDKNVISPVTSTDSVFDSDNKSLTSRLDEIGSLESVPVGTIIEYTSSTLPNNYLLCNGAAISRTTYAQLFAVIGTTYGSGDGSTTFNLPTRAGYVTASSTNTSTTQVKYFIIKYQNTSVTPTTAQVIDNLTSTSTTDALSSNMGRVLNEHKIEIPISIPADSDLNSYRTTGFYYCNQNTDAATISNVPEATAFSLLVERHAGVKQTFTVYSTSLPTTYIRNYYGSTWGSWTKISNTYTESYMSSEHKLNATWIDGKPIYRKVYTVTPTTTSQSSLSHGIGNIDKIWIADKSFLYVTNVSIPVNYYRNSSTYVYCHATVENIIYCVSASGWLNKPMYITIEYTKTTD